jgi:hypothetical protein
VTTSVASASLMVYVDMVHGIFGETAVGRESVGAVTLVGFSVVEARGVHALAASLALAATRMDFHTDAFANLELIDVRSESDYRAHIFVTGRKILVEGQSAFDTRRRAAMDDLKISRTDGDGVDADQNFGSPRNRSGFVAQEKLVRVAQNPGFHLLRDRKFG